jgi:hypothetical protein
VIDAAPRAAEVPLSSDKPLFVTTAALVFGAASFAEAMQGLGVPLLGRTFDPLDVVMYGAGVLLAAMVDRLVLARLFTGWSPKA